VEESSRSRSQAAYTDIDGTVTAYNTIFEFLRFDAAEHARAKEAEEFLAALRTAAANAVPRSVTYTGGIEEALVGEAKARAVLAHTLANNVDLAGSFAYGDHPSDLPFMALAGESLLVDAKLRAVTTPVS
jgi:hypothetical protein